MSRGRPLAWLALALLPFAVSLVRAVHVPVTAEEALAFFGLLRPRVAWTEALEAAGPGDLVSTCLGRLAVAMFGSGALALRAADVLAHAVYLGASLAFVARLRDARLRVPVFLGLNAHPLLLESFALAQAGGLACAFTMLALGTAWRRARGGSGRSVPVWLLLALSSGAQVSVLVPLVAVPVVCVLDAVLARSALHRHARIVAPCVVMTLAFTAHSVVRVRLDRAHGTRADPDAVAMLAALREDLVAIRRLLQPYRLGASAALRPQLAYTAALHKVDGMTLADPDEPCDYYWVTSGALARLAERPLIVVWRDEHGGTVLARTAPDP